MAVVDKRITVVFDDGAPLPLGGFPSLSDGLLLEPVPNAIVDPANEYRVALLRPNFAAFVRDHCHRTALSVCFAGKENLNDDGPVEETARSFLNSYLHAMMIHRPAPFAPVGMVTWTPSTGSIGNVRRLHDFGGICDRGTAALTAEDFRTINDLYSGIQDVVAGDKTNRVSLASAMYHDALRIDTSLETRFVGLMTGLEALVGSDTEITHQLAERTAFLLGESNQDRLNLYVQTKRLYGTRSKIVHGSTNSKNRGKLKEKLPAEYGELLELIRSVLVSILLDPLRRTFFRDAKPDRFDMGMKHLIFLGDLLVDEADDVTQ